MKWRSGFVKIFGSLLLIGIGLLVGYLVFGEGILDEFDTDKSVPMTGYDQDVDFVSFEPERQPYYPISDCAASRLYKGDRVYVSLGGGPNGIRSYADVHPADNIIGRAYPGDGMWIIGGPKCSWGWLLWKVDTDSGLRGWTPETKDGVEFWLVPVDTSTDMVETLRRIDPDKYEVYEEASRIMADTRISDSAKREKMRVLQSNYGEEAVAWVIRMVPIYDTDEGRFISFDNYTRSLTSEYGSSSGNAPIDKDPVGAGLSIFFNPSVENITEQLGLDSWP